MAIVELKKISLCGSKSFKNESLKQLQLLGGAHLIALDNAILSTAASTQKQTKKTVQALKYLSQCAKRRQQVEDGTSFDCHKIICQAADLQIESRNLADRRDFLINRIKEIKPWGNFTLSTEDNFGGIKLWFYIIPKPLMTKLKDDLIYQVVHKDNLQCYVVVMSEHEPPLSSVPVPRTHTGTISLSKLTRDLQAIEIELEDRQAERQSLTRWISLILLHLLKNEDNINLLEAGSLTFDDQNLFAIQAWVPAKHLFKYHEFAKKNSLALLVESAYINDSPPTLLENISLLGGGEEVVKFYQTPAYHDWDPSVVVFFSFAFFFAMILSDAGYACVFLLILLIKWKKLGGDSSGKKLRVLAAVTIVFSMIWGVLSGGYFGFSPNADSFAGNLKIIDVNDFDSMMKLSIAIGVIHIIMANLIKTYQLKQRRTAFSAIGWICLVAGGFFLWLTEVEQAKTIAYCLVGSGGALLLFFSSDRKLTKASDYIWQLLDGIKSITRISKIFGDILSYLRLFALGLASASLALTFNQLAEQVYHSASGLGLLFSILILILGHSLNLLLCMMSGVVHGLRLNFIEFYSWSVSDEGYPFKAFSKKGER